MQRIVHILFALSLLFLGNARAQELSPVALRHAFPQLSFERPVFLSHSGDGSDRVYVVEQRGLISVFPNRDDVEAAVVFLDIEDRVNSRPNEAGLLSIAFHPRYADNGLFYIYYNHGDLFSRVSEFRVSTADPDRADENSERVLLDIGQPAGNHNGGQIAFGPDRMLYIGLGDGGGANDRFQNGQDPTTLLGAILRIDINATDPGLTYAIPGDNPFVGNDDGWREEIWAYGLRNPWRFSFDRLTGQLWAGDVGQGRREEIDLIAKGLNYGWNRMEGFSCFPPASDCSSEGLALPIIEYDREAGRSITGGYVYRGRRTASLTGTYLYADFVTRNVWGLRYQDGAVSENVLLAQAPGPVASFGEDEAGEVYLLAFDGNIYTFVSDPEPTAIAFDAQPTAFHLEQNFPNPFNPQTTIRFNLPKDSPTRLSVYNAAGQHLHTLLDEFRGAGPHQVYFDATALGSGLYFYRLRAGDRVQTRKMVLVK